MVKLSLIFQALFPFKKYKAKVVAFGKNMLNK